MVSSKIKKLGLMKILTILSVIALPLLHIPSQMEQTVFAKTSSTAMASGKSIGATVEASVLNVRDYPSLSGSIVGKLKWGTKITIHDEQSGWAKVGSPSGVQGWVYEYYIAKDAASVQTQPVPAGPPSTGKITDFKPESTRVSGVQTTVPSKMHNSQEPLKGKTIVLDPGHGGMDDGTTSIDGTHEKTLTLSTAQAVQQKLASAGANVIMTRTNDTYIGLLPRSDLSNQNHADAFISFHYNWSNDPSINGLTDFYYVKSKDNSLASDILNEVVKTTGLNNDGTCFDDLSVLRNNSQPSTLIELGFLSNKKNVSVVENSAYPDQVAQGVYQGLLDYFSSK